MVNYFSPTAAFSRGQGIEESMARALREGRLDERSRLDDMARRKAAAAMGSQNYFTGFEGVQGAERPNYLKELYASGDMDEAAKMEAMLAAPHTLSRGVTLAGQTEEAKKSADYRALKNAFGSFFDMGGTPQLPPDNESGATPAAPMTEAPSIPGKPKTTAPNLMGYSGDERSIELTPTGPKIGVKRMSPFDKAAKSTELNTEGRRVDINAGAERRQVVQAAHENVRKTREEIANTQKAMQSRDIDWASGKQKIADLTDQLAVFSQQRDQLLAGGTPESMPVAPAATGTQTPRSSAPATSATPAFTDKERGELDVKNRTEKMTAANKEIENARLGAAKVGKFKRQVTELFDLVTKQDIGHPTMEGVPGAANLLSMNRANAQVKKLNEAVINMFAEPGQSQMMNTIVERQMQGAVVPSIFTDPQLNKINAAILRSNVEHLQNFPSFLEKWQKGHNNTLEGAAEEWLDYTAKNPLYTYSKDARGKVVVKENNYVLPIDKWLKLKATGGVRDIKGKTFIRENDGSWVEK
jgi:hypothetical protein